MAKNPTNFHIQKRWIEEQKNLAKKFGVITPRAQGANMEEPFKKRK